MILMLADIAAVQSSRPGTTIGFPLDTNIVGEAQYRTSREGPTQGAVRKLCKAARKLDCQMFLPPHVTIEGQGDAADKKNELETDFGITVYEARQWEHLASCRPPPTPKKKMLDTTDAPVRYIGDLSLLAQCSDILDRPGKRAILLARSDIGLGTTANVLTVRGKPLMVMALREILKLDRTLKNLDALLRSFFDP